MDMKPSGRMIVHAHPGRPHRRFPGAMPGGDGVGGRLVTGTTRRQLHQAADPRSGRRPGDRGVVLGNRGPGGQQEDAVDVPHGGGHGSRVAQLVADDLDGGGQSGGLRPSGDRSHLFTCGE
ncbi:hypothetical protein NBRGN_006_00270 [Nocardia brasiliensis NBRC 14402]|nr:hypothetical protein NBRGN_006_00270 [Nocardia brasiliensis NBRC 14402]